MTKNCKNKKQRIKSTTMYIQPFILLPTCVYKKVDVKKYCHYKKTLTVMECSLPTGIQRKIREGKLRSGVNSSEAFQQTGVK